MKGFISEGSTMVVDGTTRRVLTCRRRNDSGRDHTDFVTSAQVLHLVCTVPSHVRDDPLADLVRLSPSRQTRSTRVAEGQNRKILGTPLGGHPMGYSTGRPLCRVSHRVAQRGEPTEGTPPEGVPHGGSPEVGSDPWKVCFQSCTLLQGVHIINRPP